MTNEIGLVHLYCGEGKGKTTAAMGLIIRALGHKKRVILVQLMKNRDTGELAIFNQLGNITILRGKSGYGFSFSMTAAQKQDTLQISNENLQRALDAICANECDMLVIDEAAGALNHQLASEALFRKILECKPANMELVLTGRKMPQFLIDAADYITEMKAVRHPFSKGIKAREGIEY